MNYDTYASKWSSKRKSKKHLAHDFLEKPAMYDLLPSLNGSRVLCLGCGSGEECMELKNRGARSVTGIDNAKGLVEQATYQYPECRFLHNSMERAQFEKETFDLVFASLTLHYVQDWVELLTKINSWLVPGGFLIFSTHHPVKWGAQTLRNSDYNQFLIGYRKSKKDESFQIWGDYLTFRKIQDTLFGELDIEFYHRPISQMFQELRTSGFIIQDIQEPLPLESTKKTDPEFYQVHSKIPLFVLFKAQKPFSNTK